MDSTSGPIAEYGRVLTQFRTARGMSQRALGKAIGISHVLLSRSEAGQRPPAGPEEVAAIAHALSLSDAEHDQLLTRAGYWPSAFTTVGVDDPALRALVAVLAEPTIPEDAKHELRDAILAMIRAFRCARTAPALAPSNTSYPIGR